MEEQFRLLGFNPSEARVYLALASAGHCSAALLAKRVGVPRTTAYSVLQTLVSKGLVSVEHREGAARYIAQPPASLQREVERERQVINEKERAAAELSAALAPYFQKGSVRPPRQQLFEGQQAVMNMLFDRTAEWRRSLVEHDNNWWGYQDHDFVSQYRRWLDWAWESMAPTERILLVSNTSESEQQLKGRVRNRTIRTLSRPIQFTSTIWVLGEFIIMLSTKEEPHYGIEIRDRMLSGNLRSVFTMLWEGGTEVSDT